MARTPHLRTNLTSAEIADAVNQAADLITSLTEEVAQLKNGSALRLYQGQVVTLRAQRDTLKANYANLLADWNADQEVKADLNRRVGECRTTLQAMRNERATMAADLVALRERVTELIKQGNMIRTTDEF